MNSDTVHRSRVHEDSVESQPRLSRGEILLERNWTWWYDGPLARGSSDADWEKNLTEVGRFHTVQGFWRLWNNLDSSKMLPFSNFRIFEANVMPKWEDEVNRNGGKISVVVPKTVTATVWMQIGEDLENVGEISGLVLSNRPRADCISVWVKNASHVDAVQKLSEYFDKLLREAGILMTSISFSPHQTISFPPITKGSDIDNALMGNEEERYAPSGYAEKRVSIPHSRSITNLVDNAKPSPMWNDGDDDGAAESLKLASSLDCLTFGGSPSNYHRRHQSYHGTANRLAPFRRKYSTRVQNPVVLPPQHIRTRSSDGLSLKSRLLINVSSARGVPLHTVCPSPSSLGLPPPFPAVPGVLKLFEEDDVLSGAALLSSQRSPKGNAHRPRPVSTSGSTAFENSSSGQEKGSRDATPVKGIVSTINGKSATQPHPRKSPRSSLYLNTITLSFLAAILSIILWWTFTNIPSAVERL